MIDEAIAEARELLNDDEEKKMKFDKSRVYTALNADELEKGDIVFVANSLYGLKHQNTVRVIDLIDDETVQSRFDVGQGVCWALAYLIAKHDDPYKEFKKAQAEGKEVWHLDDTGNWQSNLNVGCDWIFDSPVICYSLTKPEVNSKYYCFLDDDLPRFVYGSKSQVKNRHIFAKFNEPWDANEWCQKHAKFVNIAKAWLKGQKIELKTLIANEWKETDDPDWDINTEYCVKPEVSWKNFKLGDKVEYNGIQQLVSAIFTKDTPYHICLSVSCWLNDNTDLKAVKKLEE